MSARVWGPDPSTRVVPTPVPSRAAPEWTWAGATTWAGLAVVLTAAAVLSFAALRDLAIAVRIDERLAFLFPISVDAGAAVACSVWLSRTAHSDARRFACGLTWWLLSLTVIGNAAQLGMGANGIVPPWWVAVLVGAVAPAVVGGVVHLAVLVGRGAGAQADAPADDEKGVQIVHTPAPGDSAGDPPTDRQDPPTDLETRARELVADGAGRPRLRDELGVSDHRARQLLQQVRQPASNGASAATNGAVVR